MGVLKAVSILVVCAFFACEALVYTDCGSHGNINSLTLEPCEISTLDHKSCIIKRGFNYTTHVNFTATRASISLQNICHGIFNGVPAKYDITPLDACGQNGISCPLLPGEAHIYTATVQCPTDAPQSRLVGKWEVVDQDNHDMLCFAIPMQIV